MNAFVEHIWVFSFFQGYFRKEFNLRNLSLGSLRLRNSFLRSSDMRNIALETFLALLSL